MKIHDFKTEQEFKRWLIFQQMREELLSRHFGPRYKVLIGHWMKN